MEAEEKLRRQEEAKRKKEEEEMEREKRAHPFFTSENKLVSNAYKMGLNYLSVGDFKKAWDEFQRALFMEVDASGYFGMLLAELQCKSQDEFNEYLNRIVERRNGRLLEQLKNNPTFQLVERIANSYQKAYLEDFYTRFNTYP